MEKSSKKLIVICELNKQIKIIIIKKINGSVLLDITACIIGSATRNNIFKKQRS